MQKKLAIRNGAKWIISLSILLSELA